MKKLFETGASFYPSKTDNKTAQQHLLLKGAVSQDFLTFFLHELNPPGLLIKLCSD